MLAALGYDKTFEPVQMQNTHWYNAGRGRGGWTPNPELAPQDEVKRVGLHDCTVLGCTKKHAGTKTDYEKEKK
jgi:hypothetical protein